MSLLPNQRLIPFERAAAIHKDYMACLLGLAPIAKRWDVKEGTLRDAFVRYRLPLKRQGRPKGWGKALREMRAARCAV